MKKYLKIFLMMFVLLNLSGCKKYFVDSDNIKSSNEIELTILEKLNNQHKIGFELEFISQEDYKICEFYLHECITYSNVEGAKKYIYDGISEDGYIFNVTYSDPYYDDKGNYHEEEIVENYLKEKDSISNEYIIRYYDEYLPGAFYNLKLAKSGAYTLYAQMYTSLENEDTKYYTYRSNLDKTTTERVLKIFDYIKEKENIQHEIYEFYYDTEIEKSKISSTSENYIKNLIYSMKSIAEEGEINNMSSKEYGIKNINELYDEIFGEEIDGENENE